MKPVLALKISLLFLLIALTGCASVQYEMAGQNDVPVVLPTWEIAESPFYAELQRTYGSGASYERAKIKYLLGHTRISSFEFDRNGHVYDGDTTADHLQRKYMNKFKEIDSARKFVDFIATKSSTSGREYYALPGDGKAYYTGTILSYELERLENFMDMTHGA